MLQRREGVKASPGKTLFAGAKRDLSALKSLFGNLKSVFGLPTIGLCILNHRFACSKTVVLAQQNIGTFKGKHCDI